jgi:tetratricopeptide (TPR) repeat protein
LDLRGSNTDFHAMNQRCRFYLLVVCLLAGLLWAGPVVAQEDEMQDKVVLTPGGRLSTKVTLTGEILEYNGEILRIRTKLGEEPKEYSSADVVEVRMRQVPLHAKGMELFQQQDYTGAAKALRAAIETEPRTWVRRDILANLVRCHLMQGDYRNAASRFAILLRSDPQTRSFPLIPLIWSRSRPDSAFRSEAQRWLLDENDLPAIRLLGASALLEDAELGVTATATLKELAANKDRRVGVLAGCQLWRLRLAGRTEINLTELKSWGQRLDSLPEPLRSGPHYLLGRAYASRKEFELAAVHFLWQPLVQPDDHFLASRATLEAADALNAISQLNGAIRLYEEVVERFSGTPAAQEAAGQLKSFQKGIKE